uniref:Uncharacterized protein n=1 Tax=Vombatus ursinus TaxID=29139 RepID=A0A4X2L6P0_VOMUR
RALSPDELQETAQELLSRLKSRHLFQSEWDIAAFVVFLTFVGEYGDSPPDLPLVPTIYHCGLGSRLSSLLPTWVSARRPKGVDNLALEP